MSKPIDVSNFPAPGRVAPAADPTETPKPTKRRKVNSKTAPIRGLPLSPDGFPYAGKVKPPKRYWELHAMCRGKSYGPFYEMGWDTNEAAHDLNTRHEELAEPHTSYSCKELTADQWHAGKQQEG